MGVREATVWYVWGKVFMQKFLNLFVLQFTIYNTNASYQTFIGTLPRKLYLKSTAKGIRSTWDSCLDNNFETCLIVSN